ncbi:hypothetical protein CLOHYLEM_04399 [[Clostridium] hylemonae DSM 15053]|uniref:Uncharacterized protein n=2 Tax=[Clostridium] hylemonae TaxID=89153 RepID=C0BX64_9FIRM|nr:hypothetical protein CLOHYLEM_04399 [[Clostridium] hylemonae DSM 15053]
MHSIIVYDIVFLIGLRETKCTENRRQKIKIMTKGRFVFRLITGGYLAYLGIGLIKDALTEMPKNYTWYTLAGAAFAVIGIGWLLTGVRTYLKEGPQEPVDDDVIEEAQEETASEEIEENTAEVVETPEDGNNIEETDEEKE